MNSRSSKCVREVLSMDGVGKWFVQIAETSWSLRVGAGTRDRTGDTSLEGWGFTAKLCPRLVEASTF